MSLVIYMIYGDRLKQLREEKEVKQYELAKILGFHNNGYGQFERETTLLPIKHLNTLSNFFKVSLDYLFNFTNIRCYKYINYQINLKLSGIRLKEFRKENHLTQEKLAKYLNTTHTNLVGYEKGRYIIATPYLYMICKKYNISADYLLGKIDSPKNYK